ncbi:MAG TPA: tetratricopeptide repeat protein [bacterium]|nr:tetratricopeptide repeat protein [bacterium]HPN43054.1 tetratricopeptide repeat protein [bacterium]
MTGTIKPNPPKIPKKKGIPVVPFLMFLLVIALVIVFFWQKKSTKNVSSIPGIVQNTQMDTTVYTPKPDSSASTVANDSVEQIKPPAKVPEVQTTTIAPLPQQPGINTSDYVQRYENAMSLYHREKYTEAMREFNTLISEYPSNTFKINCHYWIGECYFGQENYAAALETFQKVLTMGTSDKNDDAVMMIGRCYYKMQDKMNARLYFNKLINEYPYSEYVEKARLHLSSRL